MAVVISQHARRLVVMWQLARLLTGQTITVSSELGAALVAAGVATEAD